MLFPLISEDPALRIEKFFRKIDYLFLLQLDRLHILEKVFTELDELFILEHIFACTDQLLFVFYVLLQFCIKGLKIFPIRLIQTSPLSEYLRNFLFTQIHLARINPREGLLHDFIHLGYEHTGLMNNTLDDVFTLFHLLRQLHLLLGCEKVFLAYLA